MNKRNKAPTNRLDIAICNHNKSNANSQENSQYKGIQIAEKSIILGMIPSKIQTRGRTKTMTLNEVCDRVYRQRTFLRGRRWRSPSMESGPSVNCVHWPCRFIRKMGSIGATRASKQTPCTVRLCRVGKEAQCQLFVRPTPWQTVQISTETNGVCRFHSLALCSLPSARLIMW